MDERYKAAESRCVEKLLESAFKFLGDEGGEKMRLLERLLESTAKAAFAEGYDAGYCNGADDARDID